MTRVKLQNIAKSYAGVFALKDVSLEVKAGEIHALMGENGAGKSTLMKILSGACNKDKGKIFIDEEEVDIRNTQHSKELGIGIIYQEFSLVPDLSVAENIFLDKLSNKKFWIDWKDLNIRASSIVKNIGFEIKPDGKVSELSVAKKQVVEIAKALSHKVKVLILDEPSTVLGPQDIQRLFDTLNALKKTGVSIIYISHHLSEIFAIADRITVLKDGYTVFTKNTSETSRDEIITAMLGRSLDTLFPNRNAVIGKEALKVENLSVPGYVNNMSVTTRTGEVVGIAGLVGSGRTEFLQGIFGARKISSGKIVLNESVVDIFSPKTAVKYGIGMVPEDRKQQGALLELSIKENISISNYKNISNQLGFISKNKESKNVGDFISGLRIKASHPQQETGKLSGGNQQKVVIAKWLNTNCKVILIDEPTRGVDVGAKVEIYQQINLLAEKGVAVLIVSSEANELMGICDRILVMKAGKLQGELGKKEFSEEKILRMAVGAVNQ